MTKLARLLILSLVLVLAFAGRAQAQLNVKERDFLRKNSARIDRLVKALLDAKDRSARTTLLKKNKAVVTTAMVKILVSASGDMIQKNELTNADTLATLALESAEFIKDKPLMAGTTFLRASILRELSRPVEAIILFRRSAALHQLLHDSPREAECHSNVGGLLLELNKPTDAVVALEKCIALYTRVKDDRSAAAALNQLGTAYERLKQYPKCLGAFERSLALILRAGDKTSAAVVCGNIAKVYIAIDQRQNALPYLQKSLALYAEAKNKPGEAGALIAIGDFFAADKRLDVALDYFTRARETARDADDKADEAEANARIGGIAYRSSNFITARDAYRAAVEAFRAIGDPANQAMALDGLGLSCYALGEYDEATIHLSLSFTLKDRLKDTAGVLRELNNLSLVYYATGEYARAIEFLQYCASQFGAVTDQELRAATLNNLGALYYSTAQNEKARALYEDALKDAEARRDVRLIARTAVNLAKCFGPHESDAAKKMYEKSLAAARETDDKTVEAAALLGLAEFYEDGDKAELQLSTLNRCLDIAVGISNPALESSTLTQLGALHRRAGRLDEAQTRLTRAAEIAARIAAPEVEADSLNELGLVYRDRKQWDEAIRVFKRAIAVQEQLRAKTLEPTLQISRGSRESSRSPYYNLILCQMETQTTADDIFAFSEMTKARALVNLLQNGRVSPTKGMTEDERAQEQRLRSDVFNWSQILDASDGDARKSDIQKQLRAAQDRYEVFRQNLYVANPALQTKRADFAPITVAQLGKSLFASSPDLGVLSFVSLEKETLVFVITEGADGTPDLVVYRLAIPAEALYWYTAQAYESVSSHDGTVRGGLPTRAKLSIPEEYEKPSYRDAGNALYSLLICPLEDRLKGKKQLIIVPDGPLSELPFQALIGPDDTYLCERFAISYAPSVTALSRIMDADTEKRSHQTAPATEMLAVGHPNYSPKWALPDLPGTGDEVTAIGTLFGASARTLSGKGASESGLKSAIGDARIVHLATHGLLNTATPLFSSVALSPDKSDDGMLYAREIMDLELHADLAVLSACQTALGDFAGGEGVLGLGWALYVAGAPAAILTQWSVADASTSELMITFYKNLRAGMSKVEALRQAQLALIRTEKYAHPYFWAPFILTGDWR